MIYGQSWTPSARGSRHLSQFPQATKAEQGKLQKMPNKCCLLASTSHPSSLNMPSLSSSCHGHFKIITYPKFCRNVFSRNASRVLIFEEDLEISPGMTREYRPPSYKKCMGVVFYSFPEATTKETFTRN